ncbi:MFS transporter [Pikeienuella piscinae]|uniref:MFS transporter n=1 Tax=Pikeienuella piscinae TaxID=2748098 RepID=A0A7L5BUS2_9RHOB|nr:MFS transporter [Pikeienuella piscinae]QIE55422.1 MFS transporter [Pikeienuella piscinae]
MSFANFLRVEAPWLGGGALMALSSSFGQTYFIAIYAGVWRAEFGLSHGEWGAIYMTATLASAAVLTQAGRLADVMPARRLALIVLFGFALVAIGVSNAPSWQALAALVFGLRFCGQGMMTHIAMTSMGKWYRAQRARAVAIATLGTATGEAAAPAIGLAVIALIGWRASWLVIAAVIVLVIAPLLAFLLRRERAPRSAGEAEFAPGMEGRHWTRSEMTRHWLFWALIPGLIGPSWIGTVIFFQTVHLAEIKDWDLVAYAGLAFPVFSAVAIGSSFLFGWAADRFGVLRLLPVFLLGTGCGAVLLGLAASLPAGVVALGVSGLGSGGTSVVMGALFAELYGARWLGSIRSIIAAITVLASALGPGASGAMLDAGIGIETQCLVMGAYLLAVSLWFVIVSRRALTLTTRA